MADTILVVIAVFTGLILAILAVFLTLFVKNALPRIRQAKTVLDRTDRLLANAEERRLVDSAVSAIADGGAALSELRAKMDAIGPFVERTPEIAAELSSAISEARALMERLDGELPPDRVRELIDGAQDTMETARRAAADLEDLLRKAKHTRDTVTDGIVHTRDKVEEAVNLVGALKAGVEAGMKALKR